MRHWQDIEWDLYNVRASLNTVSDILTWQHDPEKRAYFSARYAALNEQYRALNAELTATMRAGRK
jgi:ABC-type Zn uptake system ZnuABC Zn-binding protein ZnuA